MNQLEAFRPTVSSPKMLILPIALMLSLITLGVNYILLNWFFRWSGDYSFRIFLLDASPDHILTLLLSIFSTLPFFLSLLVSQFIPTRRFEYPFIILYGILGIVYSSFSQRNYIFMLAFAIIPINILFLFISKHLWPFVASRKKLTLVITISIVLLLFFLFIEFYVSQISAVRKIQSIRTIGTDLEVITKEKYDSVSYTERQANFLNDKRYLGRGDSPIKWVDKEHLLFSTSFAPPPLPHELWITNIHDQQTLQLVPAGISNRYSIDPLLVSPDGKWIAFPADWIKNLDKCTEIRELNLIEYKCRGGGIILVKIDGTKILRINPPICGRVDEEKLSYYKRHCQEMKWDPDGIYIYMPEADEPDLFIKLKISLPVT